MEKCFEIVKLCPTTQCVIQMAEPQDPKGPLPVPDSDRDKEGKHNRDI